MGAPGPPDRRRTERVGRHQAVCVREEKLLILMAKGPSGPERDAVSTQILPAENYEQTEVTLSRKKGVRGKGACEHPLRVGAHRSRPPAIFGSFHRWKEHSSSSHNQNKKVGATQNVTPTGKLYCGLRSKAELCRKFFCLLFFQEK